MSEPTYLIRLSHDPHYREMAWEARVYRISDDRNVTAVWGATVDEATLKAQAWIREEFARQSEPVQSPEDVYAMEDGELIVGESVRVLRQTP